MKLNINAKELLALYNVLYQRFEGGDDRKEDGDDVQLRQVYNRIKACVLAALTNKAQDPLDAFFQHEQAKIDQLAEKNESLKAAVRDPNTFIPKPDILSADDDEEPLREYPRKQPPPPNMPKPGKHRGRR
jgi:hypothetical protein